MRSGNHEALLGMLSEDATWTADGGGKVPAASRVIEGRERVAKLLAGYRGGPKGDVDALVAAVASAASYVVSNASIIEELDVNPVMVLPEGDGVVAADALIRLRKNP